MLWKVLLAGNWSFRCGSAASLNESSNREIITGRYLEPGIGHENRATLDAELTQDCR